MNYKELILTKINNSTGIKGVDLVLSVMEKVGPGSFESEEYHKELEKLVKDGRIIELEYTIHDMAYRAKSLYFPNRTTFRFVKNQEEPRTGKGSLD